MYMVLFCNLNCEYNARKPSLSTNCKLYKKSTRPTNNKCPLLECNKIKILQYISEQISLLSIPHLYFGVCHGTNVNELFESVGSKISFLRVYSALYACLGKISDLF